MKRLLLPSVLVAGMASATAADLGNIYITGATAFRANVYSALTAMIPGATIKSTANQGSKANQFTFSGTTTAGDTVVVYCGFSGSVEGFRDIIANLAVTYCAADSTNLFTHNGADFTFSDVFQSSTIYNSPAFSEEYYVPDPLDPDTKYAGIGVIPFVWGINDVLKGYNTVNTVVYGGVTNTVPVDNISDQIASQILANGQWPLAFFTGDSAHQGVMVNVTGRNNLSGTRTTLLAETGYGIFTTVQQRKTTGTSPSKTWTWFASNDGHNSGGNVKSDLNFDAADFGVNAEPACGYLGQGDAQGLDASTAVIRYNGMFFDVNGSLVNNTVTEGNYTYWGYEHFAWPSTTTGTKLSVFKPLFVTLLNNNLSAGIKMSDMHVYRLVDGGPVFPLY